MKVPFFLPRYETVARHLRKIATMHDYKSGANINHVGLLSSLSKSELSEFSDYLSVTCLKFLLFNIFQNEVDSVNIIEGKQTWLMLKI